MSVRLVNYWVPQTYDVDLSVSLSEWHLTGAETITCTAEKQTNEEDSTKNISFKNTFTLHAGAAIIITSVSNATYYIAGGQSTNVPFNFEVKIASRDKDKQTITFQFENLPDTADTISFRVEFNTPLNTELRGLYRCTYKEPIVNTTETGEQQYVEKRMASTHFEPVGARLMYLCVDEPAARVNYKLTVRLPLELAEYTVLSNGPLLSKNIDKNPSHNFPIEFRFQEITSIPTYLTCLVIGDLDFIESILPTLEIDGTASTLSLTPIRFYAVKGKAHKAKFALDVARFSLHYFENFFQSKFPMPKLDFVAVPDFPIGGMENWGCICVTENALMPHEREEDNPVSKLKNICNLIAHEVSHNWFGNLVGIDWWNGLWLKEGFATWCGIQGTVEFRPKLREEHSFYGLMNEALEVDGYAGSHPIEVNIEDPADITQVFDSISYNKGMSVCNMLQSHLGKVWFGKGLAAYINKYAYKNTTTEQLWQCIQDVTKVPVVDVMESFTKQKGFPLVTVALKNPVHDYSKGFELEISQEKFTYLGCPEDSTDEAHWKVPFRLAVIDATNGTILLEYEIILSQTTTIPIPAILGHTEPSSLIVLANPGGAGFYRVHYKDAILANQLAKHYDQLPEMFRRSILNDFISVYATGHLDLVALANILKVAITKEESFATFADALEGAEFLQSVLEVDGIAKSEGSLATDLRNVVQERCEELAQKYYDLQSELDFILTPEQKLTRSIAVSKSIAYRRKDIKAKVAAGTFEASQIEKSSDDLLKWALLRSNDFLGLTQGVPTYTVTDPETLASCLSIPLIMDPAPEFPAFARLLKSYDHVDSSPEKAIAVLTALSSNGQNVNGLKALFMNCARNKGVRSMWGNVLINGLVHNKAFSAGYLWDHWKSDWPAIFEQWGHSQFRIQRMIGALARHCGSLKTKEAANDWKTFFTQNPCQVAKLDIERGYETILLRSLLHEKDAKGFAASTKQ